MNFKLEKGAYYAVLTLLEEKLDARVAPTLKGEFMVLSNEGVQNIILDLGATKFVDSSGLSAMLFGNRQCEQNDGVFMICTINDHVNKMLQITQLNSRLHTEPTRHAAESAVKQLLIDAGLDAAEVAGAGAPEFGAYFVSPEAKPKTKESLEQILAAAEEGEGDDEDFDVLDIDEDDDDEFGEEFDDDFDDEDFEEDFDDEEFADDVDEDDDLDDLGFEDDALDED